MRYPGELDDVAAAWLHGRGASLRAGTAAITDRYGRGKTSSGIDLASYVASRMPATFAACRTVMAEVARIAGDFQPVTFRDVGSGPGTASWAANDIWSSITTVEQIESNQPFRELATLFNAHSGIPALANAKVIAADLRTAAERASVDLVVASYVLVELPEAEALRAAFQLWSEAARVLILIEPGTTQGFARLKAARGRLLKDGAHVIGPCAHGLTCPMSGKDWCHFKVRVQRSRAHMHAKAASVPFEDEPYGWIAVSKMPVAVTGGRIVAPVEVSKGGLVVQVCASGEIKPITVASREKATYKLARKLAWGDAVSATLLGETI